MQAIKCELCGSGDLVKKDGLFVCEHCGTKYTAEEARKLFVTVTVDHSEETDKLLVLARRAKDEDNPESAARYYEMVMRDRPNDWEAVFYEHFFTARQVSVEEIWKGADIMGDALMSVLPIVREYAPENNRDMVLAEILSRTKEISELFLSVARNKYANYMKVERRRQEYVRHMDAIGKMWLSLEMAVKISFPDHQELLTSVQTSALSMLRLIHSSNDPAKLASTIRRLETELAQHDPNYRKKQGCYVATCVYGSYDCPEVWTLRRFRDGVLAKTLAGRAFIRVYYAVSPTLVRWFGDATWFRRPAKALLDRMVARLERK